MVLSTYEKTISFTLSDRFQIQIPNFIESLLNKLLVTFAEILLEFCQKHPIIRNMFLYKRTSESTKGNFQISIKILFNVFCHL